LPNDVLYQIILRMSNCITENIQVTEDATPFFGWPVALWPPLEYGDERILDLLLKMRKRAMSLCEDIR